MIADSNSAFMMAGGDATPEAQPLECVCELMETHLQKFC